MGGSEAKLVSSKEHQMVIQYCQGCQW
jgi:hypothetical protein